MLLLLCWSIISIIQLFLFTDYKDKRNQTCPYLQAVIAATGIEVSTNFKREIDNLIKY